MVLTKVQKAIVFTIVWCILVFTFAILSHAKEEIMRVRLNRNTVIRNNIHSNRKRKGLKDNPKYTRCRLAKIVKTKSGVSACIYRGGNQTYELVVENKCPRNLYVNTTHAERINIDDIVNSLNNAMKKKK